MQIDPIIDTSLGVIESFEDSLTLLETCIEYIENENKLTLARQHLENLYAIKDILEGSYNAVDISDNARLAGHRYNSIIYQLGIAGDLVRLKEGNATSKTIAEQYNLKVNTVRNFFKHYDQLTQIEKSKLKASSVMNTTERLEDLMNMCLRSLNRVEGINDDVHVKYIGELRQTLGLAASVAEKIATYKTYENFRKQVQDILIDVLPERKLEIIGRLKSIQDDPTMKALPSALGGR